MANNNSLSRRKFLSKSWSQLLAKSNHPSTVLNPIHSALNKNRINLGSIEPEVLFLNRSSFGIRPVDYARVKSIGIENYLEEQLDYESIDNSELEDIFDVIYPLVGLSLPELIAYIQEGQDMGEDRITDAAVQLISTIMMRQLYSKHQLYEVMVEFWTNHFNVDISKGFDLFLKVHEDKSIIRPNALTNFRQILHADSKSSAMMYYLDNYTNTKFGPNENYARELMELHTMGVDGGFTEEDVKEVARCFTGWSIGENSTDYFAYYPETHDDDPKTVFGNVIHHSNGIRDGEQVIDLLADSSVTASFISSKLIRRFCTDVPDPDLVIAVTKKYITSDGDIKEMLRTIFHSNQFLDSVDSKFKRPIEFVCSLIRTVDSESTQFSFEQRFAPLTVLIEEYETNGQVPLLWAPPTGYPDVESYWSNVSSLLRRINLATGVGHADINYSNTNEEFSEFIDFNYQSLIQDEKSADGIIILLENSLLYRELMANDRQLIREFLLQEGDDISELRIRATIGILLSSSYFQLR